MDTHMSVEEQVAALLYEFPFFEMSRYSSENHVYLEGNGGHVDFYMDVETPPYGPAIWKLKTPSAISSKTLVTVVERCAWHGLDDIARAIRNMMPPRAIDVAFSAFKKETSRALMWRAFASHTSPVRWFLMTEYVGLLYRVTATAPFYGDTHDDVTPEMARLIDRDSDAVYYSLETLLDRFNITENLVHMAAERGPAGALAVSKRLEKLLGTFILSDDPTTFDPDHIVFMGSDSPPRHADEGMMDIVDETV